MPESNVYPFDFNSLPAPMSRAPSPAPDAPAKKSWREALAAYLLPESRRMLALGFAAGLPLLLVIGTLSFRLREAGIDRAEIGYLSWVGLAYGFKWMWAPLVDRVPLPLLTRALGRRRAWLLAAQAGVMAGLAGMALLDPRTQLAALVLCALLAAFASATQDIALDAYRIECAPQEQQAALAACYQTGYRLAMIWAGAGALWLAGATEEAPAGVLRAYDNSGWMWAYLAMAASMLVGVWTVLRAPESAPPEMARAVSAAPQGSFGERALRWLRASFVAPFAEFFARYGWHAALLLALIGTYRISDVVMGVMANPFYVDMGFTKLQVAAVTKTWGVAMTLAGAFVGGALALRFGVMRVLMLGALLAAGSNLLFSWLAALGQPNVLALAAVVSADNLAGGIASAAFVAYLSGLTNIQYSATQYALFSSLMLLGPKLLAGFSGVFVNAFGYQRFFTCTAALGVPVLALIWLAMQTQEKP